MIYCDPSVIAAVILLDSQWERIASHITSSESSFSNFGFGEVTSAIALRARRGEIDNARAIKSMVELGFFLQEWHEILLQPDDITRATELVAHITLSLRLPDAIHIAVAGRIGATLLTTDAQQHRAATAIGVPSIHPLTNGTRA